MCTASSSIDNRTTNNHRFVFHCGVVCAYERLFLPEEPYSLDIVALPSQCDLRPSRTNLQSEHGDQLLLEAEQPLTPDLVNTALYPRGYLPTPPPDEGATQNLLSTVSTPSLDVRAPAFMEQSISSPLRVRIPNADRDYFSHSASDYLSSGDIVYWHHLARHGEIPACCDNAKARGQPA
jgi:hypothetical protein